MSTFRKVAGAALIAAAAVSISAATANTAIHGVSASTRAESKLDIWARTTDAPPARESESAKARSNLDGQLAAARAATAKYVTNLALAKKNGYQIITRMIPTMGYHFMNPSVKGFDVTNPPILVYEHQGSKWELGAIEWVFPSKPKSPPLPGAHYGAFGAGCHYADGTYVPAASQSACPAKAPGTRARFGFWHPNLVTMHVWLWYLNPNGLFASTNPRVAPFDQG
jgi:hypothetical protein